MALLCHCFMTRGPDTSVQRQTDKRIRAITTVLLIVNGVSLGLQSLAPDLDEYVQQVRTRVDQRMEEYTWWLIVVSATFVICLLEQGQDTEALLEQEEEAEARPLHYHRRTAATGG